MDLFRSEYVLQGAVGIIGCQDPSSNFFHRTCRLLSIFKSLRSIQTQYCWRHYRIFFNKVQIEAESKQAIQSCFSRKLNFSQQTLYINIAFCTNSEATSFRTLQPEMKQQLGYIIATEEDTLLSWRHKTVMAPNLQRSYSCESSKQHGNNSNKSTN